MTHTKRAQDIFGETVRNIRVANPGGKTFTIPAGTLVAVEHGADIEHLYISRDGHTIAVEATAVAI